MISEKTQMGAEIEFMNLGAEAVECVQPWLKCTVHDDGSVRDITYRAGNIAVFPQFDEQGSPILASGMAPARRMGLELVTSPYPYSELYPLMQKAEVYFGLIPQTSRTSVHLHVDVAGESWRYIRNIVVWAHALEAVIYRLACGGKVHRGERDFHGEVNDHRYARPLSAPIAIYWNNKLGPLINWKGIVEASTATEFVAAWGRLDMFWAGGITHYCPHRLHMVNLASVLRQGTLEWRVFDGLYQHLAAFTKLVYRVHELAAGGLPPFDPMPLGSEPDVNADWASNLFEMDCAPLWGERWPLGVRQKVLRSHYNDAPILPDVNDRTLMPLRVGRSIDMGQENFILYTRKG